MVLVLELVLGVDPAGDGHVPGGARVREGDGPRTGMTAVCREDPADTGAAAHRAEEDPADPEQREAGTGQEDGDHRGMIAAGAGRPGRALGRRREESKEPEGTYSTRGR